MLHSPLAIGNVFKRIRKRHLDKPSLTVAGEVIGLSQQAMGALENGTSHAWTKPRITKLCKFYGITLKEFDELCTIEDRRLDNPERSIHDPKADPEAVAQYKRELAAVNPTSKAINALHFHLADELSPKKYLAELNAIALRHGIDLAPQSEDSPNAATAQSFVVKHPERADPNIKGAVVTDYSHYTVDDDGQPTRLTNQPHPAPKPKTPPKAGDSTQANQSG